MFDACANGQQLKCLTVIDEYTRESLAGNGAEFSPRFVVVANTTSGTGGVDTKTRRHRAAA